MRIGMLCVWCVFCARMCVCVCLSKCGDAEGAPCVESRAELRVAILHSGMQWVGNLSSPAHGIWRHSFSNMNHIAPGSSSDVLALSRASFCPLPWRFGAHVFFFIPRLYMHASLQYFMSINLHRLYILASFTSYTGHVYLKED